MGLLSSEAIGTTVHRTLYHPKDFRLRDRLTSDNIQIFKDRKIVFIITQSHFKWPITYEKLSKYLTKSLKKKWKSIRKKINLIFFILLIKKIKHIIIA